LRFIKNRFGARILQFRDASFEVDKKRAEEIWKSIVREKLDFDITVELNLENLDSNAIRKMAEAGVKTVMTGIESLEKRNLSEIGYTSFPFEKIKDNIVLCHKEGIKVFGFFIIGFSNDSWRRIEATIRRARELNLDLYYFAVMTPYYGTELYESVKREGRLKGSLSYRDFGSHTSIVRTKFMDFEEVDFSHVYAAKALAVYKERKDFFKGYKSMPWLKNHILGEIILLYLRIKILKMRLAKYLK
jgi:radical SAM superfamily enzyme YgiQ (UPF0313 family)